MSRKENTEPQARDAAREQKKDRFTWAKRTGNYCSALMDTLDRFVVIGSLSRFGYCWGLAYAPAG